MDALFSQAETAYREKRYAEGIDILYQVLEQDDDNFEAHFQLARFQNKLNNFIEAAAEGARAVELRPKSDVAYFEQAKALHALEEYESAKEAFEMASVLEPSKKVYKNWIGMCQVALGEQPSLEEDQIVTATEIPQKSSDKTDLTRVTIDEPEYAKYWNSQLKVPAQTVLDAPNPQTYRHQWFQSHNKVEINILAKNVDKDRVTVSIGATNLLVSIVDDNNQVIYDLSVDPLFAEIDPATSRHAVLKTKIEIVLVKSIPGESWTSLEGPKEAEKLMGSHESNASTLHEQPSAAYPYAGKRIDWNKVESELKKEEKEEALDGDAGVMRFFRDIYADADDDMRRAMMKSYVESAGTALSTNWKDVGTKSYKLETPPEGAELKKFDI